MAGAGSLPNVLKILEKSAMQILAASVVTGFNPPVFLIFEGLPVLIYENAPPV